MNCFNYFRYGDVIRTKRELGYYHYGIYEKDHKVYEYSNNNGIETSFKANIHITTIWDFASKDKVERIVF